MYCEDELAEEGLYYPNGALHENTARVLNNMGASQWECLRLNSSLFAGHWYEGRLPAPALIDPAPPKPARAQALDMLRQIQDMATSKPATQGIRAVPRHRVARRKGVRKYYVRDPEKRDLIISLSGGHCENSSCKDNGYLTDVTADGQPLLEVDHVIPLGRGGLDDPFNMIALCANCHDRKTRGSTAKLLTLQFKNMIGPKRRRQIHG